MARKAILLPLAALAALPADGVTATSGEGGFMAGAAKVEITPDARKLLPGDIINDPLNVRAIYVSNGSDCAVLIGADQGGMQNAVATSALPRVVAATGCAAENVIMSATHTHSGGVTDPGVDGDPSYARQADAIVKAASEAKARKVAVRLTFGTTDRVNLNVNRDLFNERQAWVQGPEVDGPSDKTLAVIGFIDAKGHPVGVYMNYGMHPVNFYQTGVISADFPGAASNYVENRFGSGTVAVFAQAATGDQNPMFLMPRYALTGIRTDSPELGETSLDAPPPWEVTAREVNAVTSKSARMRQPITPASIAAHRAAMKPVVQLVEAEGALLGEAAIDILRNRRGSTLAGGLIRGVASSVTCPGRTRLDMTARQNVLPPYADGPDITLRVGGLRIGNVNLLRVDAEVYTEIVQRMKLRSPFTNTLVVTLANGQAASGYVYSDKAANHLSFQVIGSRLKPGCAETKLVAAAEELGRTLNP